MEHHERHRERSGIYTPAKRDPPGLEAPERYGTLKLVSNCSLVLYARDNNWKIADFGLTAEGSTKRAHTTRYSRGTSGYRAPELVIELIDDQVNHRYTNKVDVWAMGCILYEAVFSKKAFQSDFAVHQYDLAHRLSGETLTIPVDSISELLPDEASKAFLSRVIYDTLTIDPLKRPTAKELQDTFKRLLLDVINIPSRTPSPKSKVIESVSEELEIASRKPPSENLKGSVTRFN